MWSPADITALPTKNDIIAANEVIRRLEIRLLDAQRAVDDQRVVEDLQRELDERRAWLAPIRRIPNEIMSMVFVTRCRSRWDAPLAIQTVCRRWRDVVINTPEAWSFIPFRQYPNSSRIRSLAALFVERAGQSLRHVRLPETMSEELHILLRNARQRIVCLSDLSLVWTYDTNYPNLEDLAISFLSYSHNIPRFRLCIENFPKLNTFSFRDNLKFARLFTYSSTPPLIQHLELGVAEPYKVTGLIELCAPTLQVLIFSFYTRTAPDMHGDSDPLVFPHLHSIRLQDPRKESLWRFRAHTPNLRSYEALGHFNYVSFYTTEVRFLSCEKPDLHHYPRLSVLDLSTPRFQTENVNLTITDLSTHDDICPLLERIIMRPTFDYSVLDIPLIRDGREVLIDTSGAGIEWWMKPTFGCRDGRSCHQIGRKKEPGFGYDSPSDSDSD